MIFFLSFQNAVKYSGFFFTPQAAANSACLHAPTRRQTGVFPFKPFKSNTFYRYFGSSSKSLKAEGAEGGPPTRSAVYLRSIILMASFKGRAALPHAASHRCASGLGGQGFIINANLVISINGQSPVLITPSFN